MGHENGIRQWLLVSCIQREANTRMRVAKQLDSLIAWLECAILLASSWSEDYGERTAAKDC